MAWVRILIRGTVSKMFVDVAFIEIEIIFFSFDRFKLIPRYGFLMLKLNLQSSMMSRTSSHGLLNPLVFGLWACLSLS